MNKMNCRLVLTALLICLVGLTQPVLFALETTPSDGAKAVVVQDKDTSESTQILKDLQGAKPVKAMQGTPSRLATVTPSTAGQSLVSRQAASVNHFRKYDPPIKVVPTAKVYSVQPIAKVLPNIPKVQKKDKDGKEIKSSDGAGNFTQEVAAQAQTGTPSKEEKPRRWF